jgi:hypothetical protein
MTIVKLVATCIIGIAITYWVVQLQDTGIFIPRFRDPDNPSADSCGAHALRTIALYCAMIVGVVCGAIHDTLGGRKTFGEKGLLRTVADAVYGPQLLRGLLASPIVFAAVYGITRGHPDSVLAAALSFENGFFCDVVLRKRQASDRAKQLPREG